MALQPAGEVQWDICEASVLQEQDRKEKERKISDRQLKVDACLKENIFGFGRHKRKYEYGQYKERGMVFP